ncbi:unnamed protein product [Rotaria sp. Silwood2]|nr:unnamed protein product [Rotaria sp. Silwood2]CAF2741823.1 unnamed protein product [Rotaria sp. Silwood2]CAF3977154.1 unnamed protein product [Rotaria sp. Silwood2]CAF4117710.1 unnamed protein product [Rotaria sp. Silwood2]CAF4273678.1 unnamed protein product [Rotaria sp. Silwood2]
MAYHSPPTSNSACDVTLLSRGGLMATMSKVHASAKKDEKAYMPDYSFLIRHQQSNTYMLFDLGMSHTETTYTPTTLKKYSSFVPEFSKEPMDVAVKKLIPTGAKIKYVAYSHAHFDHCYPISQFFESDADVITRDTIAIFGPGTQQRISPGWPHNESSEFHAEHFSGNIKTLELPPIGGDEWMSPLATFDYAYDFFKDGSLYFVHAPGHVIGHMMAAVRLNDGLMVILGGDCCHSKQILLGKEQIAIYEDGTSLHEDLDTAKETIRRSREWVEQSNGTVGIILAHDGEWKETLPSKIAKLIEAA